MTGCYTLSEKWQDSKFIYKVAVFLFANCKHIEKGNSQYNVYFLPVIEDTMTSAG